MDSLATRRWMVLGVIGLALAVLAGIRFTGGSAAAPDATQPDVAESTALAAGECPATVPGEPLVVPPTHPRESPVGVWFGSAELWTAVDPTGDWLRTKSVWWSARFPGGAVEERPPISVVWTRLDAPAEPLRSRDPATNANSGDSGDFMIVDIDPPDPGCWRVEATYKGATLSYVVRVR